MTAAKTALNVSPMAVITLSMELVRVQPRPDSDRVEVEASKQSDGQSLIHSAFRPGAQQPQKVKLSSSVMTFDSLEALVKEDDLELDIINASKGMSEVAQPVVPPNRFVTEAEEIDSTSPSSPSVLTSVASDGSEDELDGLLCRVTSSSLKAAKTTSSPPLPSDVNSWAVTTYLDEAYFDTLRLFCLFVIQHTCAF